MIPDSRLSLEDKAMRSLIVSVFIYIKSQMSFCLWITVAEVNL